MKYKLNIEELKEIYLVSNTASYLLDKFSNEESIQQITQDNDTRSLINDFLVIAKSEIDKIEDLLLKNSGIDALYFATNYLAISGLEAINKMGLELVKDLGMLVFDDSDLFRIHKPSITAISQPISEMSVNLISILLRHLDGEKHYSPDTKIVPAKLMIRDSSKRNRV